MSSTRVLLSFKNNSKEEQKLNLFLEKKGQFIGRGNYIKTLLAKEMLKEELEEKESS